MLTSLTLRNFKCFDSQDFPLSIVTLLTGQNGMGKSSLIQALLLLRQSHKAGSLRNGLLLDGEYVELGTGADVLYDGAHGPGADQITFELTFAEGSAMSFSFDALPRSNVLPLVTSSTEAGDVSSLLGSLDGSAPRTALPGFQYLAAERMGPRAVHPYSVHRVEHRGELGADGAHVVAFLDEHHSHRVHLQMQHPEAASDSLRDQVAAWLAEVSPGIRLNTQAFRALSRSSLEISFTSGKATSRQMRPTGVGFGVSYALPVIVALLAGLKGDLILLENPDAHLHPRGQAAMGTLVALAGASGVQVICESHSDHFLNGLRIAVKQRKLDAGQLGIFYFSRTNDGERIRHSVAAPVVDNDGRISAWPDGFFDQFDRAMMELL